MDRQDAIVSQVRQAMERKAPLRIQGGNSKSFYGHRVEGECLDTSAHQGVIEYDPGELVITCRAGSLLSDISDILAENGQHLPFEPPAFGHAATVGGTVACGFSGPRRPWSGSLRDYLLGVRIVNGSGSLMRFGGQVMKNVAGYDVARLVAGSMGTLGVVLEVSFKVLPLPARELTLYFGCDQQTAIRRCNRWSGSPLPLSATCWFDDRLMVRLSGAESEVERAAESLKADAVSDDCSPWQDLREQRSGFFREQGRLWRLSLPPAAAAVDLEGSCLVEWGGAQRWYYSDLPAEDVRRRAAERGGYATLFRGESSEARFHPLPPALHALHRRIKQAFDPHSLFNRHRMYPDW